VYPFKDGHLYARNQWYVLGWADEFGSQPQRRVVMDEPILIFRADDGAPVALADRCAHRNYPLSKGRRHGDLIECGYHGFTFDRTGACVRIPSQRSISSVCRVRQYAVVERWQWVWIWMGEAASADPSGIPDHHAISLTDGEWLASIGFSMPLKARYQLLNENLLDLTHATFLHPESIGTAEVAESKVVFEECDGFMRDGRYMQGVAAPDLFREPLKLDDRIDRDLLIDYYAPGLHVGWERFKRTGVPDGEATRLYGQLKVYHALTPATRSTTHYFFAFARTFARSDEALTNGLREGLRFVVGQDRSALEAVEENLQLLDQSPTEISCRSDAGAIRGRRLMEKLIAAETSPATK
jgi:phenylpropionate dioxygenase-like ring-hydroxylating dioxygenase large terminal subunit